MHINYSVIINLQEVKKRTNLLLSRIKYFVHLNKDIELLLKFKKYFHKHLRTPFKAKKRKRISSNKANSFVPQLSVSYVQKEEK